MFAAFALDLGLGGTGAPNAAVQRARAYAERFYSGACDLTDLAAAAGVTPEHLVTAFRRQLGRTPMRYVWELRTAKAINLVQRSGLTLAEIADQCGYKSPFHLSREIKKTTASRRAICAARADISPPPSKPASPPPAISDGGAGA